MVSLLSFTLPKFLEVRDDTKKVHCPLDRKVNWMSNPLWIIEALYARGEYTYILPRHYIVLSFVSRYLSISRYFDRSATCRLFTLTTRSRDSFVLLFTENLRRNMFRAVVSTLFNLFSLIFAFFLPIFSYLC